MRYSILVVLFSLLLFSCDKEKVEKKDTPVVTKELKDGIPKLEETVVKPSLVFTVQVGAYKKANSSFEKTPDIQIMREANLYKYRLGTFETYQDARAFRNKNLSKYPDAFVQALKNGKPITIQQALK